MKVMQVLRCMPAICNARQGGGVAKVGVDVSRGFKWS